MLGVTVTFVWAGGGGREVSFLKLECWHNEEVGGPQSCPICERSYLLSGIVPGGVIVLYAETIGSIPSSLLQDRQEVL